MEKNFVILVLYKTFIMKTRVKSFVVYLVYLNKVYMHNPKSYIDSSASQTNLELK